MNGIDSPQRGFRCGSNRLRGNDIRKKVRDESDCVSRYWRYSG